MQLHKGYLPIVQQTKLTHSFHAKITQTIKKRDFFSGSVFLSFEICYALYEVFYCEAIHRTLANIFGILYLTAN